MVFGEGPLSIGDGDSIPSVINNIAFSYHLPTNYKIPNILPHATLFSYEIVFIKGMEESMDNPSVELEAEPNKNYSIVGDLKVKLGWAIIKVQIKAIS